MKRVAPLLVMVACGNPTAPGAASGSSDVTSAALTVRGRTASPGAHGDAVATTDPIAEGVPHGGQIREIAATEEGDAAITADDLDGIRLWPALDGSRAPVPVSVLSQPEQLVLFHAGRDLVAALRDVAGGVSLVRLGLDGSVRGRVQLQGDATYEEIVAVGDQLLARTSDHAVELYDADGTLRGRTVAAHGERITDLAARKGKAAAIVATSDGVSMRWLGIGPRLRWASAIRLPLTPRDGMFAIAPGKRRIAFVDINLTGLHVLDLSLVPVIVPGPKASLHGMQHELGFVDDDTVVVGGSPNQWWQKGPPPSDPWAAASGGRGTSLGSSVPSTAIVDGKVIGAYNVSLSISDAKVTRYLGWRSSAVSSFVAHGSHLALNGGVRISWLDESLAMTRTINLHEKRQTSDPWLAGAAVGPRHVLTHTRIDDKFVLGLIDVDKPDQPAVLARLDAYDRHEVVDGMLAVFAGRTVRRFRLDLDAMSASELLPALKLPTDAVSWVRVFDPARSGELVGVVAGWASDSARAPSLWVFTQRGTKLTKTKATAFEPNFVHSDASGRVLIVEHTNADLLLVRGAEIERRIDIPAGAFPLAVDRAGKRFALRLGQELLIVDDAGKELWRTLIWGMSTVAFFADDRRLAVSAPGGIVALDAATGEQVERACGWSFGLHETAPESIGIGTATVCEDPIVP